MGSAVYRSNCINGKKFTAHGNCNKHIITRMKINKGVFRYND